MSSPAPTAHPLSASARRPAGRPQRRRRRAAWLPLVAAAAFATGGSPQPPALAGKLGDYVAAGSYHLGTAAAEPGIAFALAPRLAEVAAGGERRRAVLTAPGSWWWRGVVPPGARLSGAALGLAEGAEGARFRVTVTALRRFERQVLVDAAGAGAWLPFGADLSSLAGERVELEVRGELAGAGQVAWAPFEITAGGGGPQRPNLVLVLVDTLRADRLPAYGAARATSPNLDRLLAARGVVVDRAYAPAPWTVPSIAALFASRWPGEILSRDPGAHRLDDRLPVLAEELQRLGYATAGFFGNPVVHAGNGFTRGFDTVYTPENFVEAMQRRHADDLTAVVRRWLAGHPSQPFFLYAHYVDPHDPYANPDLVGGRSPFYPDYRGPITGEWVHGLFLGKIPLRNPAEDVRHVTALYDSEIRYFDRYLGGLMAALDARTRANTLFVLTADHGEELYDHGGWKHGRTLYEEQLRVPLVWRWDGELPAGERRRGPATLLDVAPTLLAAAGAAPPAAWQGRDLLPRLRGGGRPPASEPLYAQHLLDGPVRAAAVAGRWKLILFDRNAAFTPGDAHQQTLYDQEMARLGRVELYDLQQDPGERRNLAASRGDLVAQLAPVVHGHLGRELAGLRVLLAGAPAGERVLVELRFAQPPQGWSSYFLADADRVEVAGDRLRLELTGEALQKGVVVPEAAGAVLEVAVRAAVPVRVRAAGAPAGAEPPLAPAALRRAGWPGDLAGAGAELLLWLPEVSPAVAEPALVDPETRRRLQALGYTG